MNAPDSVGGGGRALRFRGASYPIVLPKLSDPRLHLATVFALLHTLGQIEFHFRLSIPQILTSVLTCAVLEFGITFWKKRVILWPASAMLTGNGIAFILRVPGTQHGDWWSTRGLWIFAAVAAVSLLSKHLIKFRGEHIFNPSNFGLVLFFLVLGSSRTEPLEFWWGPTSVWLVLALGIIVVGALAILSRLRLLGVAAWFWLTFTVGIGVIAASGHAMSANWHLGPVSNGYFWRVLVLSPEVFAFLSFMITDPKTVPKTTAGRRAYAVSIGLLAALLIAPQRTEFAAKVGLLGALTIVCAARPLIVLLREAFARSSGETVFARAARLLPGDRSAGRTGLGAVAVLAGVSFAGLLVLAGNPARSSAGVATAPTTAGGLPQITIVPTTRIAPLNRHTATQVAAAVVSDLRIQADALEQRDITQAAISATGKWLAGLRAQIRAAAGGPIVVPSYRVERMRLALEPGKGQGPPTVVTTLTGTVETATYTGSPGTLDHRSGPTPFTRTLDVALVHGRFLIARDHAAKPAEPVMPALLTADTDRSKSTADFAQVRLTDVAKQVDLDFRQGSFRFGMSPDPQAMMGGGLCWLDYNNDGWLDLFVVNSYSDANIPDWQQRGGLPGSALFQNNRGRFRNVSKVSGAGIRVKGTGCVAADFNGDGFTDLYVSTAVDDKLLWNNGDGTFTEGARSSGVVAFGWHSGAVVADVNGDGRPDLFVAGYTDVNAPAVGSAAGFPTNHLGVRDLLFLNEGNRANGHAMFREVGRQVGLDTRIEHGLGAIFTDVNGDGRPDLYVANDADPNRLYLNEPTAGGLGFQLVERGQADGVADPNAGMGVASGDYNGDGLPDLFVTNSRGQPHAVYASHPLPAGGMSFLSVRSAFATALHRTFTVGWGDSWADLDNDGNLDLIIANGAIPVTNLKKDTEPIQVLENLAGQGKPGQVANASGIIDSRNLPKIIGRGLAAADYNNDGTVDIAINSIGGPLVLLRNTGVKGNWLEVSLNGFHPGALVTAVLSDGRKLVGEIHAGSSYLSSEDPRVHFGLGKATTVKRLIVRYPNGSETHRDNVAANQIVTIKPRAG